MSDEEFWSIIDQSRRAQPPDQANALRSKLAQESPVQIEGFEATFDQQMRLSNRWDLWGAAFVAMGGASDDSFEYFRLWLISQGEANFKMVLADPDRLAEIAPNDPEKLEFEDFAHIAPDVWSKLTSKPWDEMPQLASFFNPMGYGSPIGQPFSEDPQVLAKQYPKLWKRFGPPTQ